MKRTQNLRSFILILSLINFLMVSIISNAKAQKKAYKWKQTGSTLALIKEDLILWQFNFDKEKDKPYFHPLRTIKGYELTLERPADHTWHRGLWFSWKYINKVNYWEENASSGLSKGRSKIDQVQIKTSKDFSSEIVLHLTYSDSTGSVLKEVRTLLISAPNLKNNSYTVVWKHRFSAISDVVLDLEKPALHGGVSYGGYAGLAFRGASTLKQPLFLASSGWSTTKDTTGFGSHERWMDMTAKASAGTDNLVGLTIFDHQSNPRSPSPWYIWYSSGHNLFFMPSLLFDGPMTLTKGKELELNYKCWIHDGRKSKKEIERENSSFNR